MTPLVQQRGKISQEFFETVDFFLAAKSLAL